MARLTLKESKTISANSKPKAKITSTKPNCSSLVKGGRVKQRWPGKLIVKGVLSPQDAVRIADANVDAIYVSNHGGRQLDAAPAAITMLPLIREAMGEGYPLIFDSGVRDGGGVIKALALGADFVMLGRPLLYGIGAAGTEGLNAVIDLMIQQIDATLAQIGQPDINRIDRETALT